MSLHQVYDEEESKMIIFRGYPAVRVQGTYFNSLVLIKDWFLVPESNYISARLPEKY